ncbi:unnamed protein product [Sphagnum balticum]
MATLSLATLQLATLLVLWRLLLRRCKLRRAAAALQVTSRCGGAASYGDATNYVALLRHCCYSTLQRWCCSTIVAATLVL